MSADATIELDGAFYKAVAWRLVRRPQLWVTAVVQACEFAPKGWWRRRPFVPVPDAKYLAFRLETQYGTSGRPEPEHVVEYLAWCREMRALISNRDS